MKNKTLLLGLFFFISQYCNGQSAGNSGNTSRMSLSFLGGIGIPLEDFTSFEKMSTPLQYDGYNLTGEAKRGGGVKLNMNYLLVKNFGLTASLYRNSFAVTYKKTDELFENDYALAENTYDYYLADPWKVSGVRLGGMYEYYKSKFGIGVRITAGIQKARSPYTTLIIYDTFFFDQMQNLIQDEIKSTAFSYGGGVWLNYSLNRHFGINFSVDYTSANHDFSGNVESQIISGGTYNSNIHPITFSKNIAFVSIITGLTYHFGQSPGFATVNDTLNNIKRLTFSFAGGLCTPVGDFGKFIHEYNLNVVGEATLGFGGKVDMRYGFNERFGLGASFYFSSFNAEDRGSVSDEPGKWKASGILLGGYMEFPYQKVNYGLQLKAGLQNAVSPRTITQSAKFDIFTGDSTHMQIFQPEMKDLAFALHGGGYIRVATGKQSSLTLETDYTTAKHTFGPSDAELSLWGGIYAEEKKTLPAGFEKKISFVSIMLRLGFYI